MPQHDPRELLKRLLATCGTPDTCRKCKADVLACIDKHGGKILMGHDGVVHWVRCGVVGILSRAMHALGQPGNCKTCNAPVLWITSKNGKPTLWNKDGVSHWATCPSAKSHRKPNNT